MSQRWFIALIPDEPEHSRIVEFSKHLRSRVSGIGAPHTPPHVTIIPPFVCDRQQAQAALSEMALITPTFAAQTSGFGSFGNNCWYISIEQHRYFSNLEEVGRTALRGVAPKSYGRRIYHITVAQGAAMDESGVELGKILQKSSPPCVKVRFKQLSLVQKADRTMMHAIESINLMTAT